MPESDFSLKYWSFRRLLTALFFCLTVFTAFSQTRKSDSRISGRYNFKQLTVDNGLSHNKILTICQDHRGFIWIGTRDGLNMYDGYTFKVFKYEPSNKNSFTEK